MEASNPYEAPISSIANPGVGDVSLRHRSRWAALRWIPVFYFGLFAFLVPMGLISFGIILYGISTQGFPRKVFWFPLILAISTPLGVALLGGLGFVTARFWYACRWKRAILATVVCFVTIATGAILASFLKSHGFAIGIARSPG